MKLHVKFILFVILLVFSCLEGSGATRTSAASGNWNSTSTWVGGVVPASTDDVVIASGHNVTLNVTSTVNNITINSGGAITQNLTTDLTVTGNYTCNGTHSSAIPSSFTFNNASLILTGANKIIDGQGIISMWGEVDFNANVTIASTANLTFSCLIVINSNITVTNNGIITSEISMDGNNASSTWVNASNSTLNVGKNAIWPVELFATNGVLTASATGNTVNYYGDQAQAIDVPSGAQYYNLSVSGSNTKTMSGAITVLNDFAIDGATFSVNGFALAVKGDWTDAGTFNEGTQTVTFSGTSDQLITSTSGETFNNLTINKASGNLVLANNVIVAATLNMTAGNVDAQSYKLTLGTGTTAGTQGTLSYTAGSIIGKFEKYIASTATSYRLPVGTSSYNRSAFITFTNLTAGSLIAEFNTAAPGRNGLPLLDGASQTIYNTFVEGYWTLTPANSLASTNYALDLTGTGFTSFTITTNTRLLVRTNSSGNWSVNGSHVSANTATATARRSGMNMFGDYAFGDNTNCTVPVTSSITGTAAVCTGTTGVAYSVTNNSGSTYTWTITGGTQASGGNTNSITVNWGSTGMSGSVKVYETNACSKSAEVSLPVTIHSLPTSSISGNTSVGSGATGQVYSVTSTTGYTYNWTVTNGTIASGNGTNSIIVNWGSAGTGQVSVTATYTTCGTASSSVTLPVTIYSQITSIASGNAGTTSTWDCNCTPTFSSSIRIKSGHTVTLTGGVFGTFYSKNVTVDAGGSINLSSLDMTVSGNITNNGIITGTTSTSALTLSGANANIDGTGTYSFNGDMVLSGGNKNISSTANITRTSGRILINSGITVTNNGTVSVTGNLDGGATSSTWVNAAGSTLNITGSLLSTGTLTASATGNTVNYNGTTAQTVYGTSYYNLSLSGARTTTNISLPSGTVSVAGTFNPSATFTTGIYSVSTTNTMSFNGSSSQNIPGFTYQNISMSGGAKTATGSINLKGNWTNTTSFSGSGQTVSFIGSSAQTISGASSFGNLTINNTSGGVSISSGTQTVTGILTLTTGTLTTGGNLSLDLNTGAIAGTGSGAVSGNITCSKLMAANQYHMLGNPLNGATINFTQWSDNTAINYNYLYYYDETITSTDYMVGWTPIYTLTTNMTNMKGYALYFPNANTTIDVTGSYSHTTVPTSLTVTNKSSGNSGADGWNLVSNPFPSAIDWSASSGWTKTNIDNSIYIWDASNSRYTSYVAGVGTNGGTQYVPSMQAFWVHCNQVNGSGTLGMNNNIRTVSTNPSAWRMAAAENIFRLTAVNGLSSDETVIRFSSNASAGFDTDMDAYKMTNDGNTPNLSTRLGSDDYSINSIPDSVSSMVIPVVLNVSSDGTYGLKADLSAFSSDYAAYLVDSSMNIVQDLQVSPQYTCNAVAGDTTPKVYVVFERTGVVNGIASAASKAVSIGSDGNKLNVRFTNSGSNGASLEVYSLLGTMIYSNDAVSTNAYFSQEVTTPNSGIYMVKVKVDGNVYSGKVFLK